MEASDCAAGCLCPSTPPLKRGAAADPAGSRHVGFNAGVWGFRAAAGAQPYREQGTAQVGLAVS